MNLPARIGCLGMLVAIASAPAALHAQPDVAVFGERMGGEDLYSLGGAVLVPVRGYGYDLVLSGQYFFAPSDTTSPWAINLDTHRNLFSFRSLRPYLGAGLNYYNRDGGTTGINLKAGVYIRFMDWLIPYVQYTYRTIPSIEHSYVQIGARIMLRPQ